MSDNLTSNQLNQAVSEAQKTRDELHQVAEIVARGEQQALGFIEAINRRIQKREPLIKLLEYLGTFSILLAAFTFLIQIPTSSKKARYEAWNVINSASQDQRSSGGRIDALQDLNKVCTWNSKIKETLETLNFAKCVDLSGLRAVKAYLPKIKLQQAKLRDASFQEANLQQAILNGADLTQANLKGADLTDVKLVGATLEKANLTSVMKTKDKQVVTNLKRADLRQAKLQNANLQGTDLEGAKLQNANLQETDLENANLQDANLQGADFRKAKNLTVSQIKAAKNWELAIYDKEFSEQLNTPKTLTNDS